MDGNLSHPGRLNSAPQTVLKTVVLLSAGVRRNPSQIEPQAQGSADVRRTAPPLAQMAVILAVTTTRSTDSPRLRAFEDMRNWSNYLGLASPTSAGPSRSSMA